MPTYSDSAQLERVLKALFTRIVERDASAAGVVAGSHLVMRLRLSSPYAQIVINGRKNPVQISYGGSQLRPDLDVDMTTDAFHLIMLDRLPLRTALASGRLKVRGPVWKSFIMREIFLVGREIYPQVALEAGIMV